MPNAQNARYAEWKMWFEKILPLMGDGVILIGHSLGGIFLAKYLSEQTVELRIKATFLVAAPYNTAAEHPLVDFVIQHSLRGLEKQGGEIFLYHSADDAVVPFSNFERYQSELKGAHIRVCNDRKHFNQAEFPELVQDIQELLIK